MKPENQIQIKRNAYSFSVIVLLLSLLIGSSAWTILGDNIRRSRSHAQDLTYERDSLRVFIDSISKANQASPNMTLIVQAMKQANEEIMPLGDGYSAAMTPAKLQSVGLLPIPNIVKTSLAPGERELYDSYEGLLNRIGEYGQQLFNMNSDPTEMLGMLNACQRDLKIREDQLAELKSKAGTVGGSGGTKQPTGTATGTIAACDIPCDDCKQGAAMLEEVRRLAKDNNEFVNYDKKNKVNFIAVPLLDSKGRRRSADERDAWAKQQYISVVLKLRQTFGLEPR